MMEKSKVRGVYLDKKKCLYIANGIDLESGKAVYLGSSRSKVTAEKMRKDWNVRNKYFNPLSDAGNIEDVIAYNSEDGSFKYKVNGRGGVRIGKNAAVNGNKKYSVNAFDSDGVCFTVPAHRMAWRLYYGEWPKGIVSHINHDVYDNRIDNLSISDDYGPVRRNMGLSKANTSGYTGVSFSRDKNKWRASVKTMGKTHYKLFESAKDAHLWIKDKRKKLGFHDFHGKTIEEIKIEVYSND